MTATKGDQFDAWWETRGRYIRHPDYRGYAEAGWNAGREARIPSIYPNTLGADCQPDPPGFADWFTCHAGTEGDADLRTELRRAAKAAWLSGPPRIVEHVTQVVDPQNVLPGDLAELVQGLLEGRVVQFALAVEYDDGVVTQVKRLEPDANWWKLVGMIEVLKRDVMDNVDSDDFDFDGEEDA